MKIQDITSEFGYPPQKIVEWIMSIYPCKYLGKHNNVGMSNSIYSASLKQNVTVIHKYHGCCGIIETPQILSLTQVLVQDAISYPRGNGLLISPLGNLIACVHFSSLFIIEDELIKYILGQVMVEQSARGQVSYPTPIETQMVDQNTTANIVNNTVVFKRVIRSSK